MHKNTYIFQNKIQMLWEIKNLSSEIMTLKNMSLGLLWQNNYICEQGKIYDVIYLGVCEIFHRVP